MKKILLSIGLMATALTLSATVYRTGTALTQAPTAETKVILEGWTQANKGFMTPAPEGVTSFACLDKSNANRVVFSEQYVYTLVPVEGSDTTFYIKDINGVYAPICTIDMNTGDGKHIAGAADQANAGTYKIGAAQAIQTAAYADKYMLTNTNQAASGKSRIEVHFADVSGKFLWCYLQTGDPGLKDAGNSGRTACAFKIYEAVECQPVDVTFNFPAFENAVQPQAKTMQLLPGEVDLATIPVPEFFTLTGVDNSTVGFSATTVNVSGTWNFPFSLDRVYRLDLRRSSSNNCTKWSITDDRKISTRSNANADQFAPVNLFYLKGQGFNSDNRLTVTLHSISGGDDQGFNVATPDGSLGTFVTDNTQFTTFIVKTNTKSTEADPGISLQHSEAANAHLNDITGHLGVWNSGWSQNDGGSFIRFFDLTESDFASTSYHNGDTYYQFQPSDMETAKNDPTIANVKACFANSVEATAATLTVNLTYRGQTIQTVSVTDAKGAEVTIPAPAFFTDNITMTIPNADATVDYALNDPALPFKYTETAGDNMIWQAIQIHTSYANNEGYTWTFTATDDQSMIQHKPANLATEGFADTQLWAFVGNYNDGFKIYNKAAGTSQWLYEEGTGSNALVKVGTSETGATWKPYVSRTESNTDTYCCLSTNGTNYINMNVNANNATTLTHWTDNDNGSTCWFTAPCAPMLATVADFVLEDYNGPATAVGGINYHGADFSGAPAVIAAAQANNYDTEAAAGLRDIIARYNSANVTVNTLQPNGYYRIMSINSPNEYMCTNTENDNLRGRLFNDDTYRSNYHTIFKFETVEGQTDRYYLLSQGQYVGHVYGTSQSDHHGPVQTTVDAERGQYSLVQVNHTNTNKEVIHSRGSYALKDMTQSDWNFLHQGSSGGNISAWRQWAGGSHFFILPAEDITVNLYHTHNDLKLGFGYFPFPVSAPDEDTKLYYVHESSDLETGAPVITYSEVPSVPANTAFMVSRPSGNNAALTIGAAAAANARRRALAADGTNDVYDNFAETDTWTGTSWTKAGAENVPQAITALGVNAANVRYMDRPLTIHEGGDLTVEFVYTSGSDRLDMSGVVLLNAEGNVVVADYHKGYSGTNKENNVYTLKVPAAGTYTLRYYAHNADTALRTNGNINLTFATKDHTNLLEGFIRGGQAQAGDYVLNEKSTAAFVKIDTDYNIGGNYVYIPASKMYNPNLAEVATIPFVNADGTTTDICDINAEQPAPAKVIYDLQGRRLAAPIKGLNIINGKKVLIK